MAPSPTTSQPGSPAAIVADRLTKQFGTLTAASELTFSIPKGQLVAFLGPNGAGKSTTMRLLTGFLSPTAGSSTICGINVQQDRVGAARHLGYLPENGPLYPDMTPLALLRFMGEARAMSAGRVEERIEAVSKQCRLEEIITRPCGKLSKGNRQRVGMAVALLHDPDVLIMDEPTAGLDPNQVEHVRHLLRSLAKDKAVLLSTHILSEVRALADRVLLIHRGRLVHDGPCSTLGPNEREMEEKFRQLTRYHAA